MCMLCLKQPVGWHGIALSNVLTVRVLSLGPPCPSSHLPSGSGRKAKQAAGTRYAIFHLISSIRCPLVSYTVCANHSFEKRHMRNPRRKSLYSISLCTSGSLSNITTLSTIVDVQLNLVTNAEFETQRVGFSINIRFQYVQADHCNISRRKRSPTH